MSCHSKVSYARDIIPELVHLRTYHDRRSLRDFAYLLILLHNPLYTGLTWATVSMDTPLWDM
jgi:hypothetical protein